MRELVEGGRFPAVAARDEKRLLEILSEEVERRAATRPPPNEAIFRREGRDLRKIALVFLREEEAGARRFAARPVFLEAAIGMESQDQRSPLDTPAPVAVTLVAVIQRLLPSS